jgi:hypothetical protein
VKHRIGNGPEPLANRYVDVERSSGGAVYLAVTWPAAKRHDSEDQMVHTFLDKPEAVEVTNALLEALGAEERFKVDTVVVQTAEKVVLA